MAAQGPAWLLVISLFDGRTCLRGSFQLPREHKPVLAKLSRVNLKGGSRGCRLWEAVYAEERLLDVLFMAPSAETPCSPHKEIDLASLREGGPGPSGQARVLAVISIRCTPGPGGQAEGQAPGLMGRCMASI